MTYTTEEMLFKSGDLFLPTPVRRFLEHYYIGTNTSLFYINNWSIIHFLSGVITSFLLLKYVPEKNLFITSFMIHTIWELWQIVGKNTLIGTARGQLDVLVDTAFFMAGVWVYQRYGRDSRKD
jgi:hypothetical protein